MRTDIGKGHPTIDALDLSGSLDLHPAEVQALIRAGEILTRFEIGQTEEAGRIRLTIFHGRQRMRLTRAKD